MSSKKLGMFGEKIAIRYLKNKGYEILDKNYSSKFITGPKRGEIDIIIRKDGVISFVEVKTIQSLGPSSTNSCIFLPEDKVNFQKQRKILKSAESWLMEKKIPLDGPWQIDVISVRINPQTKKAKIRYFKNV